MAKNGMIGVLAVIAMLSAGFAFQQKNKADELEARAVAAEQRAQELMEQAAQQQMLAEEAAMMARAAEARAVAAMEAAMNAKKK